MPNRDEWYDLPRDRAEAEEWLCAALAPRPEPRPVPGWMADDPMYRAIREGLGYPAGPHCPNCHALLEREDASACLTCIALLRAPIRCVSEAEARRRGWIEL